MTTKAERDILRKWALTKGDRYRIRAERTLNEAHEVLEIYGVMPNSFVRGWWVAGEASQILADIAQGHR